MPDLPKQRRLPKKTNLASLSLFPLVISGFCFWFAFDSAADQKWLHTFGYVAFGIVWFGAFAFLLFAAKKQKNVVQTRKPLLGRDDWAKGEIAAQENASSAPGMFVIAVVFLVAAGFLFCFPGAKNFDPGFKGICLLFGVIFMAAAFYTRTFRRKFGKSFFKMRSVPGVIGGTLEGTIAFSTSLDEEANVCAQLRCFRTERRGSGDDSETVGVPIWSSNKLIIRAEKFDDNFSAIPIKFEIPSNTPESEDAGVPNRIFWLLEAEAEIPGIDYRAAFEVPLFKIALNVPAQT